MLENWIYIGLFLLLAWIFPGGPILIARFLAPHRPDAVKNDVYECGVETVGETWVQFKVQYYNFALTFLIFDVEMAFLFPWAVSFDKLPIFGVFSGAFFVLILFAELLAAWRKGALEWA